MPVQNERDGREKNQLILTLTLRRTVNLNIEENTKRSKKMESEGNIPCRPILILLVIRKEDKSLNILIPPKVKMTEGKKTTTGERIQKQVTRTENQNMTTPAILKDTEKEALTTEMVMLYDADPEVMIVIPNVIITTDITLKDDTDLKAVRTPDEV